MSWADRHIEKLQNGETVRFRPRGNSMSPRIKDGQLVTVEPVPSFFGLSIGDVVLCRVAGHQYLHLIVQRDPVNRRVLIANNRGKQNGWTGWDKIYGRVIRVDP